MTGFVPSFTSLVRLGPWGFHLGRRVRPHPHAVVVSALWVTEAWTEAVAAVVLLSAAVSATVWYRTKVATHEQLPHDAGQRGELMTVEEQTAFLVREMVARSELWTAVAERTGQKALVSVVRESLEANEEALWAMTVDPTVIARALRRALAPDELGEPRATEGQAWLGRLAMALLPEVEADPLDRMELDQILGLAKPETEKDKIVLKRIFKHFNRIVDGIQGDHQIESPLATLELQRLAIRLLSSVEDVTDRVAREAKQIVREDVSWALSKSMAFELENLVDCVIDIRRERQETRDTIPDLERLKDRLPEVLDEILITDADFQRVLALCWRDPTVARSLLQTSGPGLLDELAPNGWKALMSVGGFNTDKIARLLSSVSERDSSEEKRRGDFRRSQLPKPEDNGSQLSPLGQPAASKEVLSVEQRVMNEIFGTSEWSDVSTTPSLAETLSDNDNPYSQGLAALLNLRFRQLVDLIQRGTSAVASVFVAIVRVAAAKSVLRRASERFSTREEAEKWTKQNGDLGGDRN